MENCDTDAQAAADSNAHKHNVHFDATVPADLSQLSKDTLASTRANFGLPGSEFTLGDDPVPVEREVLLNSIHHQVTSALSGQQRDLQEYLEWWGCSQKSVIAKLLADSMTNHTQSYAHKAKDSGNEFLPQQSLTGLDFFAQSEELEAMTGQWIDPEANFNEGRAFEIVSDFGIDVQMQGELSPTPNGTALQYVVSASSDFGFALSCKTPEGDKQRYQLMWGSRDTLKIREAGSKACFRVRREVTGRFPDSSRPSGDAGGVTSSVSRKFLKDFGFGWDSRFVTKAADILGLNSGGEDSRVGISYNIKKGISHFWHFKYSAPKPGGVVGRFVTSKAFESLCALIILCNAVVIAAQADWARQNLDEEVNTAFETFDLAFCLYYVVELLLRVYFFGVFYFRGPDWHWNLFDTIIVAFAVNDQLSTRFGYGPDMSGGQDMVFLRIIRLFKMLKVLRMIRLMRMFRELRLILNSLLTSIRAMLWSMALITGVIFMFGLLFLQGVTNYLKLHDEIDQIDMQRLNDNWGSVPKALLSMYMASMNGENWRFIADPLWEVGWAFYFLFLLYTGFYSCVIANTLTSLFVEATISHADVDQRQLIQSELENKERYVTILKKWYDFIDKDGSGYLTLDELDAHAHLPEMIAFAAQLGIEVVEVRHFFNIISDCGNRPVDLETFVVGCIKLRGMAKNMDLMDLIYSHKQAVSEQARFKKMTEDEFAALRKLLGEDLRILKRLNSTLVPGKGVSRNDIDELCSRRESFLSKGTSMRSMRSMEGHVLP